MDKKVKKNKELHGENGILAKRLKAQGYTDIADFHKSSGIHFAVETIYRSIGKRSSKMSATTIIIIAKYLGYTPTEIRDLLLGVGEKEFSSLIGNEGIYLSDQEDALLSLFRKLKGKQTIIDHIKLVAKSEGIKDTEVLEKLEKGSKVITGQFGNGQ